MTAAIGPGASDAAAALPATSFVSASTPTAVTLHDAGTRNNGNDGNPQQHVVRLDPAAAAAAAAKVVAWTREYDEVEAAVEALYLERAAHVRHHFGSFSAR